jgi:hypothetical protein
MNLRLVRGVLAAALTILTSALPFRAIAADAPSKGDKWETTSQMSMEGMPMAMPANTTTRCVAKNPTEPPMENRPNCTNRQYKRDGNKVTWETACTNPDMKGVGAITYSDPGNYAGAIKFTAPEGTMTIKLSGRKLGDCDKPQ